LGKFVTDGGRCRHINLMPYRRSTMCGGDPWACHRVGLSFKYVVPCLWVNQCVGWCIGMAGRDQRSDLWDIKIWSEVCIAGASGWLARWVDVGCRCVARVCHSVVRSCVNSVWVMS
jgi:hypothetical protein